MQMRDRVDRIGVVVDARTDVVVYYSDLGFKPVERLSGALGERPEPVARVLAIRQIETAAG